uniref:ABC transporter ATP-binding protein n=1 Tax=Lacisediminihabitans sp. TaxID=2787631 RepID=UPI00374CD2B5
LGDDDGGEAEGRLLVGGGIPTPGRAGLVLQDPDSQVILARVGDDVAFGCENLGVPREQIWPRVTAALDAVRLGLPLDHPTSVLSGGQKQRLALAGVIAMQPGLLLLDEPTANLDAEGVRDVRDSVVRVLDTTGATFIVVEHRVAVWLDVVDRVVVLSPGGGVVADGTPAAVLSERGAELAARGVWVPGFPPAWPSRIRAASERLLSSTELAVGRKTVVQEHLSVRVESGRALAVTGPNGVGKSTLGLTLAGLLPTLGGEVVAAESLDSGAGRAPIRWKSRELLTRIGTVFQDPEHQFLAATVRAELEIGPRALGLPDAEITERVDALLERLRLTHLALANPFTLSGGEKRRVSVATALATRPRVLVLDEPTFGQDSRTWSELVAMLAELLDAGTAVVAMTHDDDFVRALADETLVLS